MDPVSAPARLIVSGPQEGARNMALDSALMECMPAGGVPVLRLYAWSRPTLSLGYFQKPGEVADLDFAGRAGVDLVRRPTGGGAILHHLELTLCLVLPAGHALLEGSVPDSYLRLGRPVVEALRGLGLEASFRGGGAGERHAANCFSGLACPDVVVGGRKIFGSAQRRRRQAGLFHGSLLLDLDEALWRGVFGPNLGGGFTSLGRELGREAGWEDLAARIAGGYRGLLGDLREGSLEAAEAERAAALEPSFSPPAAS